jgi:hypothetical protein
VGRCAVDQRCTSLRAFADVMVAALRNELRVQLLKLPKKVRRSRASPPRALDRGTASTRSLAASYCTRGTQARVHWHRCEVVDRADCPTTLDGG